jgi:hypothetical protein
MYILIVIIAVFFDGILLFKNCGAHPLLIIFSQLVAGFAVITCMKMFEAHFSSVHTWSLQAVVDNI